MWAWLRLFLGIVLLVLAWPFAQRMQYEHSIESLFPPGDPVLRQFQDYQRLFGSSQVVLVVYEDPQLFAQDRSGIARVEKLADQLRNGPGIADIFSVATLDQILQRWGSGIVKNDPISRKCRELFAGFTHGETGNIASVMCVLDEQYIAQHGRRPTITYLRQFVDQHRSEYPAMLVVGEPVMVSESFRLLENDADRLSLVTTLLLGITIIASLRSIRWAIIAMLTVQWTLVVTTGLLAWLQMRLSMASSMLSAVLTVVAVATVMHLAVGYQRRVAQGAASSEAWANTWTELRWPIAWACITDAVGFFALRVAGVGPVRDFGLMMALGSLFVWLAVWLLLPALATLPFGYGQRPALPDDSWLGRWLARLGHFSIDRAAWTCAVAVGITAVAVGGNTQLEIESDFTRNFRADSPIARAYDYVENRLGGAGMMDLVVPAPDVIDSQFIEKLVSFEEKLRALRDPETNGTAFSKVLSLADLVASARTERILALVPPRVLLEAVHLLAPKIHATFSACDPQNGRQYWRVMLRAYDRRRAATKEALIARVRQLAEQEFGEPSEIRVVGFYVLLTRLVAGVVSDQWRCLWVAVLGVGICLAIALRHVGAAMAAVATNVLPILLVLGALGFFQIRLNMGAAMMAAVSMGLAVDSSLHYLIVYLRSRRQGCTVREALGQAQTTVGRALLYATLALSIGFSAMVVSQLMPTVYFGLLAGATLAGSLFGNLLLLPALINLGNLWGNSFQRSNPDTAATVPEQKESH